MGMLYGVPARPRKAPVHRRRNPPPPLRPAATPA
jgi:hypothetical protein